MRVTLCGVTYDDVTVERARYADGSTALLLLIDGQREWTASVRLVHEEPADGCIWIKDWSENEGMVASLVEAGVVEVTGRVAQAGFTHAFEGRLL